MEVPVGGQCSSSGGRLKVQVLTGIVNLVISITYYPLAFYNDAILGCHAAVVLLGKIVLISHSELWLMGETS